jgi:rubredoxin-NAD+ reductase
LAGHTIYLTDPNGAPIGNLLDGADSKRLLDAWKLLPILFIGGVTVEKITEYDQSKRVVLSNGKAIVVDHVIAATGLQTPSRLAKSANLRWQDGICVDPVSLETSVENIHALGDCVSISGKAVRYIEPIHRQAKVIAAKIAGCEAVAYLHTKPVIRIKTTSLFLTV